MSWHRLSLTDTPYPRVRVDFKNNATIQREPLEVECEPFIDVKVAGFKAKGKRVVIWPVAGVEELEPTRKPEPPAEETAEEDSNNSPATANETPVESLDPDEGKTEQQVRDEITGQLTFDFDE